MPKIEVKKKKIEINVGAGKVYPALTDLEVIPSGERQEFNHEGSYGYDNVVVRAVESEQLNVKPSKETQSFDGLYNKIEVEAVTNEIDSNIVAENIKDGVNILGVKGNFVGQKYAPRKISFYKYWGENLDYELANLDTNQITEMDNMFYNCSYIKILDLKNFNTSNVTTMEGMFGGCNRVTKIDLSSFDTSKVTSMRTMFSNCSYITELNINNFNVENVKTFYQMFYSDGYLTTLLLGNFNTLSATEMGYMFSGCSKLTELNLKSFYTEKVTNMSYMFRDCRSLTELDLSSFYIPKLSNIAYMFAGCNNLAKLDIRNMEFNSVRTYANLFDGVPYNCLIIVKSDTERNWITSKWANYTNIKTVAELGDE